MGELGGVLGSITGLCLLLALLNYPVKWVNKRWISKLSKESSVKKTYQSVMRFLVQKHRYFAFTAVVTLAIHLYLQLTYRWLSITGVITGALLILTVLLGANLFFRHKGERGLLLQVHRISALATLLSFIVHNITSL
ncbi:MAG: hypothetical protein LLG09_09520 [Negativicutes bacterium]|nr:hypothetical protein [Negativicutes bacterium]